MNKHYSQQFKTDVVKQILENGSSVKQVASERNLVPQTIYRWLQTYRKNGRFVGSAQSRIQQNKYIKNLELENEILKMSWPIENDTKSIFEFIHEHKEQFAISTMCDLLNVSSSGYYKWTKNLTSDEERKHNFLIQKLKDLYIQEWPNISSLHLTQLMLKQDISTSQSTVARILKEHRETWYINHAKLHNDSDVVLEFPTKHYFYDSEEELFYHENIHKDRINKILTPKSFVNMKKYTSNGECSVTTFKKTDNLIIKSENLIALNTIKNQFKGQVKLITIDPPYNNKSTHSIYDDSLSRSTYLTFIKNRIDVARELLKEDGSIFIHCNDKEQAYIKILCDEVFGRENFINQIVWKRTNAQQNRGKVANVKDYIIIFSKNKRQFQVNNIPLSQNALEQYKYKDKNGRFRLDKIADNTNGYYTYEIFTPLGDKLNNKWIYPNESFLHMLKNDGIYWSKNGYPYKKVYLRENTGQLPLDFWDDSYGTNREAVQELKNLFGHNAFSNPKPELLSKHILNISTNKGDLVLDFFLGSGTTAAVAHKMQRQYIGIEELDHINDIAIPRLKKVIGGDNGGISDALNWSGGGSFISVEVK